MAGGGTGGHIYPGVALAREFLKRKDKDIECLMVVTARLSDKFILQNESLPYKTLPMQSMSLSLSIRSIADLYRFALSLVRSWHIISSYTPDLIIGLGAYASFPIVIIGKIRGITTLIQEQNLRPGKANRLLSRWVYGIFTSFPQSDLFFPPQKVMMLGNPIRSIPLYIDKKAHKDLWGLNPDIFTILVCGGSRGAHSVNINAMDAFRIMKGKDFPFQIIHQCGQEDFAAVSAFYKKEKIIGIAMPFFKSMMDIYPLADLVISRAGAGTISEVTATGKPSIMIPYPHAKADHQKLNAMALVRAGAARMIDEKNITGKCLAEVIIDLARNPGCLKTMAQASLKIGRPDAAKAICEQALLWFEENTREKEQNAS